jgi:hypothetical protein
MTATSRKWDSTPMWPKGQKVGQSRHPEEVGFAPHKRHF